MYEKYWGMSERPFENTPNPKFFYNSPTHEEVLARLLYVIQNNKGLFMLSGEVGCGKTTLSRFLAHSLPKIDVSLALIENPSLVPADFIFEVLYQFGINIKNSSKHEALKILNDFIYKNVQEKRINVLILDEAQLLSNETIEEVRLLLNFQLPDKYLLNIILIGQPELAQKIKQFPQFEQRIAIRYHLKELSEIETIKYIEHRENIAGVKKSLFTPEAKQLIFKYSNGIPRKINSICDLSLLIGYHSKAAIIDAKIINQTQKE